MCANDDHLPNINTAPPSDSVALQAARAADFVLIPCRPVILGLEANGASLNLVGASSTPAVTLLNAVASSGSEADEAAEAIIELGAQTGAAQHSHRIQLIGQKGRAFGFDACCFPPAKRIANSAKRYIHIGGYFDPAVSKQLRLIVLEEDMPIQDLLAESLGMLFQSRRKPSIAASALC